MTRFQWLIFFCSLLLLTSCTTAINDCNCSKVEIYGYPSSINAPMSTSPIELLSLTPFELTDSKKIEGIKTDLSSLKKSDFKDGIDNRFLLELHCEGSRNIIVESNSYLTKFNDQNYKPTDKFINRIKGILNRKN